MKGVKKTNLPQKICVTCQRPFVWRKKWESVWDDVKYCSERCRRNRNPLAHSANDANDANGADS